jgi:adenine-specific DNA-methyltransferase
MVRPIDSLGRALRRNQTDAEALLWRNLRGRRINRIKFRRQVPLADFIVDFASLEKNLVIELDGGQHADTEAKDAARDERLRGMGFTVLRFWNSEVFQNLEGILAVIGKHCEDSSSQTPPPQPSPLKGEGD